MKTGEMEQYSTSAVLNSCADTSSQDNASSHTSTTRNILTEPVNFVWRLIERMRDFMQFRGGSAIRVAFVFSSNNNYWEQAAAQATMASLENAANPHTEVSSTIFSANNSPTHLQATTVKHLLRKYKDFDVCVAFSPWIASQLHGELVSVRSRLPVLFAGLPTPDALGLVNSRYNGDKGIAGVVARVPSYEQQALTIMQLAPERNELIIPSVDNLRYANKFREAEFGHTFALARAWRRNGGKVCQLGVDAGYDVVDLINEYGTKHTVLNLSAHSSIISHTAQIVDACNRKGVPLYAHNRQAVRRGAVFGSGVNGDVYGPPLAGLILDVLSKEYCTQDVVMPLVDEQHEVCYLEHALKTQGVSVDDDTLRAMRMLSIEHVE